MLQERNKKEVLAVSTTPKQDTQPWARFEHGARPWRADDEITTFLKRSTVVAGGC